MNTLSISKHCNEINMVEVMFKFNQLTTYNDKKVKVDITISSKSRLSNNFINYSKVPLLGQQLLVFL